MILKAINFLFLSSLSNMALASEAGAQHLSDLTAPAVNAAILFGFLGFKLAKPLREHFANRSQDVFQLMNSAQAKADEAKAAHANFMSKISSLDSETKLIRDDMHQEYDRFKADFESEYNKKVAKLKSEAIARVEQEKVEALQQLSKELLDSVISGAKENVGGNAGQANKAAYNSKVLEIIK